MQVKKLIRVLDIGCLKGQAIIELSRLHPRVECHGLSLRREPDWRGHKNIFWKVGHAEKLRYPARYFDFVYSYFGETHVQDIGVALKELNRVLKRKGKAVINFQTSNLLNLVPLELNGRGTGNLGLDMFIIFEMHGFKVMNKSATAVGGIQTYNFYVQKHHKSSRRLPK